MNLRARLFGRAAALCAMVTVVVVGGRVSAAPPKPLPVFRGFTGWSTPVNLGAPVNTPFEESAPAISSDQRSLYFNRDPHGLDPTRPGKDDEDLYVANRTGRGARWEEPVALDSLNTPTSDEQAPSLSRNGKLLFFRSDRQPGSFGGFDLYVSRRVDSRRRVHGRTWSPPTNLGPLVNGADDEVGPAHFVDARGNAFLYFSLNTGGGNYDIYVSKLGANGRPGTPRLVRNLNTPANDARPTIRADGLEIVFHSNRPPSVGKADLWVSTRKKLGQQWGTSVSLGAAVNSTQNDQQASLSDSADELYFASNRPAGVQDDIWVTTRKLRKQ
jgi:Tol biopolymer transport system component